MENMTATAEAAEVAAAERAATVEAAKIAERAEVMSAQTFRLGRSSPQALAWLWPHAAPRASGRR